ncbi:Smr/MutS family protein, partial [bacterium]|nr:Smr/MutS family protein [bacterium]
AHRARGTRELLVVHGKGLRSEGAPVIAPLVRRWLKDHPEDVAGWRPAPRDWGGEGALVIVLRKAAS